MVTHAHRTNTDADNTDRQTHKHTHTFEKQMQMDKRLNKNPHTISHTVALGDTVWLHWRGYFVGTFREDILWGRLCVSS
jgi:hypothetical protein